MSCSRGMNWSVPAAKPVAVIPERPAYWKLLARPKSVSFTALISLSTSRMFSGLMSRWMKPCSCAKLRPSRAWRARRVASAGSSGSAALDEGAGQAAAGAVLHREVEGVALRAVGVQRHDVRMAEASRHLDLAVEHLARVRVHRRFRPHQLQGDGRAVGQAGGEMDDAHAAAAEQRPQRVAGDGVRGSRLGGVLELDEQVEARRVRGAGGGGGPSMCTLMMVAPTRMRSPSRRSTSGHGFWAASSGVRCFSRPPCFCPLTYVPLRLPRSRRRAAGGFTSSRKWCREAVVSSGASSAWQSGERPKRNVSWPSNSKCRPWIGPATTSRQTRPGMSVRDYRSSALRRGTKRSRVTPHRPCRLL